ncbi:hypothetical protein ACF0H5_020418 [Mactra antiquata]
MARSKFNPNFFTYPKPIAGIIVLFMIILFYLTLYDPTSYILDYYGPLGRFGKYMNKNHYGVLLGILYAAIVAHVGESLYAGYLCSKKGLNTLPTILWMLQTLIMGFPSLMQLVGYKPDKKKV